MSIIDGRYCITISPKSEPMYAAHFEFERKKHHAIATAKRLLAKDIGEPSHVRITDRMGGKSWIVK